MTGSIIEEIKWAMEKAEDQKAQEQDLLMQIAAIEGVEFANTAKRELHSEKHPYTMGEYLRLLDELKEAILEGIEPMVALAGIRSGTGIIQLHTFMEFLRQQNGGTDGED